MPGGWGCVGEWPLEGLIMQESAEELHLLDDPIHVGPFLPLHPLLAHLCLCPLLVLSLHVPVRRTDCGVLR